MARNVENEVLRLIEEKYQGVIALGEAVYDPMTFRPRRQILNDGVVIGWFGYENESIIISIIGK